MTFFNWIKYNMLIGIMDLRIYYHKLCILRCRLILKFLDRKDSSSSHSESE